MRWGHKHGFLCILVLMIATCALAELLVYEGFVYDEGGSDPTDWNGGAGLLGRWELIASPSDHSAEIVSGLTFGTLEVSGGALQMYSLTDVHGTGRNWIAQRVLDVGNPAGPVWVSFLIARTSGHSSNANMIRVMNQGSSVRDFTAEYKGFNVGGRAQLHLGGVTQAGDTMGPLNRPEPYLVIARYETGHSGATARLWILDEPNFAAIDHRIAAGRVSSDDLDQNNVYEVLLENGGDVSIENGDVLQIFQSSRILPDPLVAVYDEIRIGTTLASVIPTTAQRPRVRLVVVEETGE